MICTKIAQITGKQKK